LKAASAAAGVLARLRRRGTAAGLRRAGGVRVYYGCGDVRQPGYVNVDVRWTPAVDLLADLEWCAIHLEDACEEVFMSHVLEHYASPGKAWRGGPRTVAGALCSVGRMLRPGGLIRLAVPDFAALATLYVEGRVPLHPRILGRLVGEQDYPQNSHRCVFDEALLTECLVRAGFGQVERWSCETLGIVPDSSFDVLEGVATSLNLCARKAGAA
jgi:predicted SAM-dependent methyltransferase